MATEKCVFAGSEQIGEQLEGYSYFACEDCLGELEEELNREYERRQAALAGADAQAEFETGVKG